MSHNFFPFVNKCSYVKLASFPLRKIMVSIEIILCQHFLLFVKCMSTVVFITVVFISVDVGEELGKGKLSGDHNKAVL